MRLISVHQMVVHQALEQKGVLMPASLAHSTGVRNMVGSEASSLQKESTATDDLICYGRHLVEVGI